MSDQCMNCTVRGDLKECLSTDCSQHESWMTQEVMKQLKVSQDEVSRLKALVIQYVHFCEDLDKFVIKQPVRSETLNQFKVLMSSGKEFNERNKAIIKQLTNNQASEQKGEG